MILNLTGNLEDGLGESLDVGGGDTSDGDTAVLGGVDGVLEKLLGTRLEKVCEYKTYLLGEGVHLLGLEASVGEHADLDIMSVIWIIENRMFRSHLAGDVGPVVLAAELLEVGAEERAHLDDAASHALDLTEPLLVKSRVVHDGGGDAGTVNGRVGVEGTNEDLDLRIDTLLLLGVLANEGESTDTLTVETHVLGETLAKSDVVALLDEVAGSKGILVGVTASKALVGHVEEGEVALLLHDIADLAPLGLGRVDTGGVVSASVEEDDAALGSGLDVGNQTLEVEANGVLVVVAVLGDLETGVGEDGLVVSPAGVGEVDLLRAGVELLEESTTNAQSTGTGDGLGDDEAVVLDGGGVGAVSELGGGGGEGGNTGDASVLLVQAGCDDLVLSGADGGQNVRLALVVT